MIAERAGRLRERMAAAGLDAVIAGPAAASRWLTGLHPPIPTRLTLAILPLDGDPVILTPGLEAPADQFVDAFEIRCDWRECRSEARGRAFGRADGGALTHGTR